MTIVTETPATRTTVIVVVASPNLISPIAIPSVRTGNGNGLGLAVTRLAVNEPVPRGV